MWRGRGCGVHTGCCSLSTGSRNILGIGKGLPEVRQLATPGVCIFPELARDRHGRTPLHIAVDYGWPAAVEVLLDCGSDVSARDHDGLTPLHLAARTGERVIDLLCHAHIVNQRTVNQRTGAGDTALHIAAEWRRVGALRALVGAMADPFVFDAAGRTPSRRVREGAALSSRHTARQSDLDEEVLAMLEHCETFHSASMAVALVVACCASFAVELSKRKVTFDDTPATLEAFMRRISWQIQESQSHASRASDQDLPSNFFSTTTGESGNFVDRITSMLRRKSVSSWRTESVAQVIHEDELEEEEEEEARDDPTGGQAGEVEEEVLVCVPPWKPMPIEEEEEEKESAASEVREAAPEHPPPPSYEGIAQGLFFSTSAIDHLSLPPPTPSSEEELTEREVSL